MISLLSSLLLKLSIFEDLILIFMGTCSLFLLMLYQVIFLKTMEKLEHFILNLVNFKSLEKLNFDLLYHFNLFLNLIVLLVFSMQEVH